MLSPASVVVTARIEGACNGNVKQANAMLASIKHIVLEASPPPPHSIALAVPTPIQSFVPAYQRTVFRPEKVHY